MEDKTYTPNIEALLKHCPPYKPQFKLPGSLLQIPFHQDGHNKIRQFAKDYFLPANLVDEYYWLVTVYISSYKNHLNFQNDSDRNLKANRAVLKAIELIEKAQQGLGSISILIKGDKESTSVDDPVLIGGIEKYLLAQKERIPENLNSQKADFKNEPYETGLKAIDAFLISQNIGTLQLRAKIIGYLFSLADLPVRSTTETPDGPKKLPLSHLSPQFDEEGMIKTVIYWLGK